MDKKIDFVVIWVDGNDPQWQAEKNKYSPKHDDTDARVIRYRDWDNLQYWFRGVEKFAPWVNKIHFVTWGHIPEWLDTTNKKLNIVKHSDYIPEKYLPTFSANPIELNLHRIKGLSENFVFFNDDIFLCAPVKETDFFEKGLPKDVAIMYPHISRRENNTHTEAANMDVINSHFSKNSVIKKNPFKWFNLKYGVRLIFNFCLIPFSLFPGMLSTHVASSFNKSVFEEVWEKEYEVLDATSSRKFRYALDVNQWLIKNWQVASGNFMPRNINFGKSFVLSDNSAQNEKVFKIVSNGRYKMICVNDMVQGDDFEKIKEELKLAFDKILPGKSSFEK